MTRNYYFFNRHGRYKHERFTEKGMKCNKGSSLESNQEGCDEVCTTTHKGISLELYSFPIARNQVIIFDI